MITKADPIIREIRLEDKQKLANLIHFESFVHRHLDWRQPLEWIGYAPYLAAFYKDKLLAALALPPDPPQVAWIRLFAVSSEMAPGEAWQMLWEPAKEYLTGQAHRTAAIPLQDWFKTVLAESEFQLTNRVVMLERYTGRLPTRKPLPSALKIRKMSIVDLAQVEVIDNLAFDPLWQNTQDALRLAYDQSSISTVAEWDGKIVAYQISTGGQMGGHLARLATHPNFQDKGIGSALLHHLLEHFESRNARRVTVNTQEDNHASLALYEKTGFQRSGEIYPVFEFPL